MCFTRISYKDVKWVPYHHGTAHPRVADREHALWEGNSELYCISSYGQPARGGPPAWGLGGGLTTPLHKTISMLRDIKHGLGLADSCENSN